MTTPALTLSDPLAPSPKNWLQRHWLLAILSGVFLLFVLLCAFIAGVLAIVEGSFRNSDVYIHSLAHAQANPQVIEKLGKPLETGWFISGNINVAGSSGNADLTIPIFGPKAKADLHVVAKKADGRWDFETMSVQVNGDPKPIDLMTEPAPSP